MKGTIWLIPSPLGDDAPLDSLSASTKNIINNIRHFLAENEKHTRRFLKAAGMERPIQELDIKLLNEHTDNKELTALLDPARAGHDMGIISEAGCPGIADPGAAIVKIAHREGLRVVPVPGPSSIFLALMGSGFSGQQFAFHGYLPREQPLRIKRMKELERMVGSGMSQIFMETPYRNNHMLEDLLKNLNPDTRLCLACDITLPTEMIRTLSVKQWQTKVPNLHKRPCIFIMGV
jgi:16S rRNA (cytidine1402-2'-O)-methyltransferase